MPVMRIILVGDNAFPELREKFERGEVIESTVEAVVALPRGMVGGRPSVAFKIDLPDGRTVMAETSMRLFLMAARAFRAKYGDVDEENDNEPRGRPESDHN